MVGLFAVGFAGCGGGEGDEAFGAAAVSWTDRVELVADQGADFDSVATRLVCASFGGVTRPLPLGTYELKAELWKGGVLRGVTAPQTFLIEEPELVVELPAYDWILGDWLLCPGTVCVP